MKFKEHPELLDDVQTSQTAPTWEDVLPKTMAKAKEAYIQTNGSLDCCSKEDIKKNKENHLECTICRNTGVFFHEA